MNAGASRPSKLVLKFSQRHPVSVHPFRNDPRTFFSHVGIITAARMDATGASGLTVLTTTLILVSGNRIQT